MYKEYHAGRSFTGHRIEDECPCSQEACGLVSIDKANPECSQHPLGRFKTIRQGHKASACPELKEAWETEDCIIVVGTHDRVEATKLLEEYFEHQRYADEVHSMSAREMVDKMKKQWVNRHDNSYDEESWNENITSKTELKGWTPMLLLSL